MALSALTSRPIIYSLAQIRSFDILWGFRDALIATCDLAEMTLGNQSTVIDGFLASPTGPASLVINLTSGMILSLAAVDALVYGSLSADSDQIMQIGQAAAGPITFNTSGLSADQNKWALVQVGFAQADDIPSDDPNGGVLPYVNVSNPLDPFEGPNNSGAMQNTRRKGLAVVQIIYGAAATTGSEVPPTPSAGFAPLYLVNLTFGQTAITSVQLAGPTAFSGYQNAPYFPGVIGSIPGGTGSHHGGIAGQANKIVLTAGLEVQGIAAYPNLPVSNSTPNGVGVGGIITVAQDIPVLGQASGNPNGLVGGFVNDEIFDASTGVLYLCTFSGPASGAGAAVWTGIGSGGISSYQNAAFTVAGGNFTYLADTSSGSFAATLPAAIAMGATSVSLINIGSNVLTVTPQSGESINGLPVGTSITLLPGSGITLASRSGTGYYTLNPQLQYNVITKSGSFTASDPSGTFYNVTAQATVTMPAATGSGKVRTFAMAPSAGLGVGMVFNTTGGDTIRSGGQINTSGQFFIPDFNTAPVDLVDYVAGSWIQK